MNPEIVLDQIDISTLMSIQLVNSPNKLLVLLLLVISVLTVVDVLRNVLGHDGLTKS